MTAQPQLRLGKEQQRFFEENGYSGPYSLEDMSPLMALLQSIQNPKKVLNVKTQKLVLNLESHTKCRLIYDVATDPSAIDSISKLLGDDLLLWYGRIKSFGKSGQQWNIDQVNKDVAGVQLSVAMKDMDTDKGCIQVIPKTHKYAESKKYLIEQEKLGNIDLYDNHSMQMLADRLHPENAPHQVVHLQMQKCQYYLIKGGLWNGIKPDSSGAKQLILLARYTRPQNKVFYSELNRRLNCIIVQGEDTYGENILTNPPLSLFRKNIYLNHILNRLVQYFS
ncbi:MAG: phytanoyl-CoA dioxygenase family protein [Synechococcus sp.]